MSPILENEEHGSPCYHGMWIRERDEAHRDHSSSTIGVQICVGEASTNAKCEKIIDHKIIVMYGIPRHTR